MKNLASIETAAPVGAMLTRSQLRRRNKQLAKVGRRICTKHQGAALTLTEEYFYAMKGADPPFRPDCKACCNAATARRQRRRYHSDPVYAEMCRAVTREAKQAAKQRHFTRVLRQVERARC